DTGQVLGREGSQPVGELFPAGFDGCVELRFSLRCQGEDGPAALRRVVVAVDLPGRDEPADEPRRRRQAHAQVGGQLRKAGPRVVLQEAERVQLRQGPRRLPPTDGRPQPADRQRYHLDDLAGTDIGVHDAYSIERAFGQGWSISGTPMNNTTPSTP